MLVYLNDMKWIENMNLKIILLFFGIFFVAALSAQEENTKNVFRYTINTKYNIQKDEVFSRVGRQTFMYGADIAYERILKEKIFLGIALDANLGNVNTFTKTNNTAKNYLVNFALANRYKINTSAKKFNFWLGAKLIFDLNALLPDKELRYGWDISLSLNPNFYMDYKVSDKIILSYETDFSLLGILWRPNAQGFTLDSEILLETKGLGAVLFEEKTISSLHNMFKWNQALRMEYAFKPKTSLQIIYNLQYTQIAVPRTKTALTNGFKLGIIHKF